VLKPKHGLQIAYLNHELFVVLPRMLLATEEIILHHFLVLSLRFDSGPLFGILG
jgi:hypothetical protein